jgi:peroxiredoxin
VMGDSRVTAGYDIKALPLTYLVDSKGRVAATYSGVVARGNLEANIKALLAESR